MVRKKKAGKQSLGKIDKEKGLKPTKEEKKEERKNFRKKQESQIKIFLVVMFFLLVFIFVVYMFIQASLKFSYAGLEFEKIREGELILYRTPVFPVFLRYDPRELRDIKIDGKIVLNKNIGIGGKTEGCSDNVLAAYTLNIFYSRIGLKPFSATTNESEAKNFNITYVECNLNANYSAILFERGDENKIKKQGNCYALEFSNCEIMKVTERFMVASYAHSRGIEI